MDVRAAVSRMPWVTRLALLAMLGIVFTVVFGPLIAPFDQYEVVSGSLEPWSASYLLGTDHVGRDMLSRLIYGLRNTFGLAFLINTLAFVIGGTLGIIAITVGGWLDQVLSRIVDMIMAVPQLILALLVLSIFGTSITVLITTITVLDATRFFRISRAAAMNVVVMEFVEAAQLRGEGLWWNIMREVLPNTLGLMLAEFGIRFCYVVLFVSALSFLGLGLQPPAADLGSMVRETAMMITFGVLTPLLPAGMIAILVVSVNFVSDWLLSQSNEMED